LTVDGRLKPMDWVFFWENRPECSMVRMYARSKPVFVAKEWIPKLPVIGMCVLAILAGMLMYQLAGPGRGESGSGGMPSGSRTISVAPPSFVFESELGGRIHF
jgi:hypothetical protein